MPQGLRVRVPPRAFFLLMKSSPDRRTPAPEYFSCRVYGVLKRGEQILLTRSHFTDLEFVNFPGGGVELGEAPREALLREFKEETGLTVRPVRVLYSSEGLHVSTRQPMQIVSTYWEVRCDDLSPLRTGGNGEDVIGLFWADIARIPTGEMFPSDKEFSARLPRLLER